ncbi:MAG: hypothetical protein P1V97_32215 [Planctomycetota bacterium]|nr:hypothetical protein [Planctomycetota bacterium]
MIRTSTLSVSLTLALASLLLCPSFAAAQDAPTVTIEAENKPLMTILKELGDKHGLNYVVSQKASEAAGGVNCRLKAVSLDRAIQMLCAACNLEAQVDGRFVIIRVPKKGERPRFNFPENTEPKVAKRSGVKDILGSTEPNRKKTDSSKSDDSAPSSMATTVGKVLSITKRTLIVEDEFGKNATYHLPASSTQPGLVFKLTKALETLRTGHRVVISYSVNKKKLRVINAIIGGRDPRSKDTVILPKDVKKNR